VSRFDEDGEGGMPWDLWETVVSNALGGRRGQEALAAMEAALLALPEPKLIEGRLAAAGQVCAVGALVAHRRAQEQGVDIQTIIDAMGAGVRCWCGHGRDAHTDGQCGGISSYSKKPCGCEGYEPESDDTYETVQAGKAAGLSSTVAWHLSWLNDESLRGTPEQRYAQMLAWVRRAQGKEASRAARDES
jgi:hypothetical protein